MEKNYKEIQIRGRVVCKNIRSSCLVVGENEIITSTKDEVTQNFCFDFCYDYQFVSFGLINSSRRDLCFLLKLSVLQ